MPKLPLHNVRWLTLREIAEIWATEGERPVGLLLRELRTGVLNIPRLDAGEILLEHPIAYDHLPSEEERVDRDWLQKFCGKQGWRPPSFWFAQNEESRRPGRPSSRDNVLGKFNERHQNGLAETTIADEARAIHAALAAEGYDDLPKTKTIQSHIRQEWHRRR